MNEIEVNRDEPAEWKNDIHFPCSRAQSGKVENL